MTVGPIIGEGEGAETTAFTHTLYEVRFHIDLLLFMKFIPHCPLTVRNDI